MVSDVGFLEDGVGSHGFLAVSAMVELIVVHGVWLAVFVLVAVRTYVFC